MKKLVSVCVGWMLMIASPPPVMAGPPGDEPGASIERIKKHLNRARTYYRWARATQNSVIKHRAARTEYRRAESLARSLPAGQRQPWLGTALAGQEQAEGRIDNAYDTFRNVYAPVWWILGQDRTLETYDDRYMRALLNAWEPLPEGILGPYRSGRYRVLARCRHPRLREAEQAKEKTFCAVFRDEVLGHADTHPRLVSVTDDHGWKIAGPGWSRLIQGPELPVGPLEALARSTGSRRIVILDLKVADEISLKEAPLAAVRVDISARIWDAPQGKVTATVTSSGVSVSVIPRRKYKMAWMAALFLLAVLFVVLRSLVWDRSRRKAHQETVEGEGPADQPVQSNGRFSARTIGLQTAVGGLAYLVGGGLGYAAGKISGGFVPLWMDVAYSPAGGPRGVMLLWPLVHGAVVMLGPIAVCAYLSMRFLNRLASRFDLEIDLQVVIPSAQAGALAWLFAPLVLCLPGQGIQIAASLSIAGMLMGVATARPMARFLDPDMAVSRAAVGIGLGMVGLLLLLPWGLYNGHHFLAAGTLSVLAVPIWLLGGVRRGKSRDVEQEKPESEQRERPTGDGDLSRPGYVTRKKRRIATCQEWLEAGGLRVLVLRGPKGIGKSRFVEQLVKELQKGQAWQVGQGRCEEPPEREDGASVTAEPYQLVSDALQDLAGIGRLSTRQARWEQAEQAAEGVGKILETLPGFGMLVGSKTTPGMTRDMLVNETVIGLDQCLKQGPVLLVLDDAQWADDSSRELLAKVLSNLRSDRDRRKEQKLGIVLTTRGEGTERLNDDVVQTEGDLKLYGFRLLAVPRDTDLVEAYKNIGDEDVLSVELGPLGPDQVKRFLVNVKLDLAACPEFVSSTVCEYTKGNPFEILSFIYNLVGEGILEKDQDGWLQPTASAGPLNEELLLSKVPQDIVDRQRARLERLQEDDLLALECATLCGRVFAISDVAEGLSLQRLEVIRRLHRIEEQAGIVVDGDRDDDHFEFDSEVTREALRQIMNKKHGEHCRELVKEIHSRVAARLIQQGSQVSPGRVAHHCSMAGERLVDKSLHYSMEAARHAVEMCAWRESLVHVKRAREAYTTLERTCASTSEQSLAVGAKLSYLEACALRGRGDKGDLEKAHPMFKKLVSGEGQPSYDVLLAYLDCAYYIKGHNQEILEKTNHWLSDSSWGRPLDRALADFFRVLASVLPAPIKDEKLRKVWTAVEAVSGGEDDRRKEMLLARVIQVTGDTKAGLKPKQRAPEEAWRAEVEAWRAEVMALFDQSLELKEKYKDRHGEAINYGSRGNFHLFFLEEDYAAARDWFNKDVKLAKDMGDVGALSGLINRIGLSYWKEADAEEDATRQEQLRILALDEAVEAMKLAQKPIDKALSAISILEYSEKLGTESVNSAGLMLSDEETMKEVLSQKSLQERALMAVNAVKRRLGEEEPGLDHQQVDPPWIGGVLAELEPT